MGCIAVGIYCADNGKFKVFDTHARDVYGKSHPRGTCVLLDMPSMQSLVQYFQSLYGVTDVYELKGVHIGKFEMYLQTSNNDKESNTTNMNQYKCLGKQCCVIALYSICYSIISPCHYRNSSILDAIVENGNHLYNKMGINRHLTPADIPNSVAICGAEINVVIHSLSQGKLSCNSTDSKPSFEKLILNNHHGRTGFLLGLPVVARVLNAA